MGILETKLSRAIFISKVFFIILLLMGIVESSTTEISECGTIAEEGEYVLTQDLTTTGTCITINADNITLDGAGFNIDGIDYVDTVGIDTLGVVNITIKNVNITDFSRGIRFNQGTNNSLIENTSIFSSSSKGIDISGNNNKIINNTVVIGGSSAAVILSTASYNNFTSNIFRDAGFGMDISLSSSYNSIVNNTFSSIINGPDGFGIYIQSNSENNTIVNNTMDTINTGISSQTRGNIILGGLINNSQEDAIIISGSNNNITNITIINTSRSYYDIVVSAANNTYLVDMPHIGNYSFTGVGSIIKVRKTRFGEIKFLAAVNGSGNNFTRDIRIANNSVFVNSVQTGLNKPANITLYGLPTNFADPVILKDGVLCNDCYNFTHLNAGTVTFNVSSWSNYSIGERPLVSSAYIVAHYRFNDSFNDSSGNGNHGSAVGTVALNNGVGIAGAASFPGGNSYVNVPDSISLDIADNLSLSLWMNAGAYNLSTIFILNKTDGTSGNDISWDVEFDSNGNIVIGSVSYNSEESIIRKMDRNGNVIWNKSLFGKGIYDLAIDNNGNVYGIGRINNYVVKYDSNGNLLWNGITATGIVDGGGAGIDVDSAGNFVITSHNSNNDLIVEKRDSNGNLIWSRNYSGAGADHGYSVDVDDSDNIYVTGYTRAVLGGNSDVILLKYDSNGNLLWSRTYGGSKDESGYGLTTDSSGNVYVTGRTKSFTNSVASGLLLKYDSSGNLLWNKTFSPRDDVRGNSIVEKDGKVYVTGTGYSSGNDDLLFYTYDLNGSVLDNKILSGYKYETGEGIAVDSDGTVAIVGHSDSALSAYDNWILLYGKPVSTLIDKESYGIEYNGSSVIGYVNNKKISSLINSGWQFVGLTYDNSEIKLYINDSLVSTVSYSVPIATSNSPLNIGNYYNGLLDEVKVFNRTLSLSDVQQIYNEGKSALGLGLSPETSLTGKVIGNNKLKKGKK